MIDNRIYTFLELCTEMNYRKTAEKLNMTQPAVTQHIKYLENLYNCELFRYEKKKLSLTQKGVQLQKYARTIISLNKLAEQDLMGLEKPTYNIGATKTIGEYMILSALEKIFKTDKFVINITIDNTENLLNKLNHFELDILMLEGFVEKEKYYSQKISQEEMVGICSREHPFANKEIELSEIIKENIVIREKGSGTRAVFAKFLENKGYSIGAFKNKSVISSNKLIEHCVQNNLAISFVYSLIPKTNDNIATFRVCGEKIMHEFNYIFINKEKAKAAISAFGEILEVN